MFRPDVLIVGAGLSGLSCALRLHQAGFSALVLEASDGVGGRVRTDELDGFLLDRGFQVFLMAYPEAQRVLDYGALDLKPFYPGALVRFRNRFFRVSDPWRHPLDTLTTLFAPIGSFHDKLLVARLRQRVRTGSLEEVFRRPETSTIDALKAAGFSDSMIERFFRPFIGGVFLDEKLQISSRMFEFVYRMFSLGHSALPARGMGAIPNQLALRLPEGAIRTRARVVSVHEGGVTLESGEMIKGRTVILATEGSEAARLLGERVPPSRSVTCLYFASAEPPITDPILALDGDGVGPVINLCVPSQVAPAYAPHGQSLVCATVLGNPDQTDEGLETAVRSQLILWFGRTVQEWRHLRTYRVIHALPMQNPPVHDPSSRSVQIRPWLFLCGEYESVASIQWALFSGRRAAEAVIRAQGAWEGSMAIELIFLAQVGATLAMVGITWFAQVVHYPLFGHVGRDVFSSYEALNMRLTNFVVGPLILVEGGTALVFVWLRPEGVLLFQALVGMGFLVVIWLSTVFLQVPMHNILTRGYDDPAHRALVRSNWIRTVAWSGRGLLVLWMVGRVMG